MVCCYFFFFVRKYHGFSLERVHCYQPPFGQFEILVRSYLVIKVLGGTSQINDNFEQGSIVSKNKKAGFQIISDIINITKLKEVPRLTPVELKNSYSPYLMILLQRVESYFANSFKPLKKRITNS